MKLIKKIAEAIKRRDTKKNAERVQEDYQIAESGGKLWLTFWGHPFIPQDMLKDDIIEVLKEIRQLHMNDKV